MKNNIFFKKNEDTSEIYFFKIKNKKINNDNNNIAKIKIKIKNKKTTPNIVIYAYQFIQK